jgi:flagellar biosynthesis protein FlhB
MVEKLKRIFLGRRAIDVYKRALKTFIQAFIGALIITLQGDVENFTVKSAIIGGIAAGVSAVMNLAYNLLDG